MLDFRSKHQWTSVGGLRGGEALTALPGEDGNERFARRSRRKETNNTEINKRTKTNQRKTPTVMKWRFGTS